MKLKTIRPLYHKGAVLLSDADFETGEQHGRELLRKGYASEPKAESKPTEKKSRKAKSEDS